jgi:ElaB/YqjD/DUF883 family membrane-anchored ribosome-binding protein
MNATHDTAAERIADDLKGKLGDIAADAARTAVAANIDQATEVIEARYGAVLDPAGEVADRFVRFVRGRPLVAVLIAAAAGFAIGRS